MNIGKFIIIAEQVLMKVKNPNGLSFNELWTKVTSELKLSATEAQETIGQFYNELLENASFVLLENKNWTHRDLITFDQYDELSKSLFSTVSDDVKEDEFLKHMSKNEMKEYNKEVNKAKGIETPPTKALPTEELSLSELDDEMDIEESK